MRTGGCTTQAPGHIQDQILDVVGTLFPSNVLQVVANPGGKYRSKYYALFINGTYIGVNTYAPLTGNLVFSTTLTRGTQVGSVYIEDAGDWASFDSFIPKEYAEREDALTARRLLITWNSQYEIGTIYGDTSLSNLVITGAIRNVNTAPVTNQSCRARIQYTLVNSGTTRTLSLFKGSTLVAHGSRTGDGSITLTAVDSSGLAGTVDVSYTADVNLGDAFIELVWPAQFQVHYSTGSLSFPRSPEATVLDNGASSYFYLTPVLANGVYNWNVLTVSDQNKVQSTNIPVTLPKTLQLAPNPVTDLVVTGNATGLILNWVVGTAGCTYRVYYSKKNQPVNFGRFALPAPVTTAVDATTTTLPAITDYSAVDAGAAYTTVVGVIETSAAALNAAYVAGETGYSIVVSTQYSLLRTALGTFGDAIDLRMIQFTDALYKSITVLTATVNSVAGQSLSTSDWQLQIKNSHGALLGLLGSFVDGNAQRFKFTDGSTTVDSASMISPTLYDVSQPSTRNAIIRIIVRATKGGVEEATDNQVNIELDPNTGGIILPKPNPLDVASITLSNTTLTIKVVYISDNEKVTATYADLYVITPGTPIDLTTPTVSASLASSIAGVKKATLSTNIGAPGWFNIAVVARSASGARSTYEVLQQLLIDTDPDPVTDLTAKVLRGGGNV